MSDLLRFSLFQDVLFPETDATATTGSPSDLTLQKLMRFRPNLDLRIDNMNLVIFDFETTGLDAREDRIIEIGAQRIQNGEVVETFSHLIDPEMNLTETVVKLTGITQDMLTGKPKIADVLPDFLQFMEGAVLSAHNAEFDMSFLRGVCEGFGYQLDWPCFCTLKMARALLPELESKNLDSLAAHYGFSFDERHRSVGDVSVTHKVLDKFLKQERSDLQTWADLLPFAVTKD